MRERLLLILAASLVLALVAAIFGGMWLTERRRVADAEAAFRPLGRLGCVIWSQPTAFDRHCRYAVEFPPECNLSDANAVELEVLNCLPQQNILDVVIRTRNVTDRSLRYLGGIETLDLLDVTQTKISDQGIEALRRRLPECLIPTREPK